MSEQFKPNLNKAIRRSSDAQFEAQAEERNKYRALYQKFLGLKKASTEQMQYEQAHRMNDLVDQRVRKDDVSWQDAADDIADSREFEIADPNPAKVTVMHQYAEGPARAGTQEVMMPGAQAARDRIEFKEFLRDINPDAEAAIERGDLAPASEIIASIADDVREYNERHELHMGLIRMIDDKIDSAIQARNIPWLQGLLLTNDLRFVDRQSIERMPDEVFSRDVRKELLKKLDDRYGAGAFLDRLRAIKDA